MRAGRNLATAPQVERGEFAVIGSGMISPRPSINWPSPERIEITRSADLCHLFDSTIPGHAYLRCLPVVIVPERIAHVIDKGKDGRVARLKTRPDLIICALESPEIVEARPEYRDGIDHYKVTYVVEDDQEPGIYVGVAISLANLPSQPECDEHYIFTVYCPEYRTFFTPQGEIKPRWQYVDRMPWSRKK